VALDARYGHQRSLEEATILREMGQREAAKQRLDRVLRDASAAPMASLQAGVEYLALGHQVEAETALQRAAAEVVIADYHLAQLKLQQGEVDKCMQLLERVAKAQPAEVRRRLHDEVAVWSAVSGDARFQQLTGSPSASPMR
jgi:tetratricopeptide (TPR) repeat protein